MFLTLTGAGDRAVKCTQCACSIERPRRDLRMSRDRGAFFLLFTLGSSLRKKSILCNIFRQILEGTFFIIIIIRILKENINMVY